MSEPTIFDRGDLVWVRLPSREWMRGIVTDCFRAPITGREVVVVGGTGYYADDDVVPHHEPEPAEPQSLRAPSHDWPLSNSEAVKAQGRRGA